MYYNPSRMQSKISVLTEIEVTLQSIQDTEYLHKTQTKFRKKTHMNAAWHDWLAFPRPNPRKPSCSPTHPHLLQTLPETLAIHYTGKWTSSQRHANYSRATVGLFNEFGSYTTCRLQKRKLCYINPGPNASALSLIHLIVLPSIIVTYPGCSQSHPHQQLNKFFSPAADHRGWFPNHWEPTDLSNEQSRWNGNPSETGYAADCFQHPL